MLKNCAIFPKTFGHLYLSLLSISIFMAENIGSTVVGDKNPSRHDNRADRNRYPHSCDYITLHNIVDVMVFLTCIMV